MCSRVVKLWVMVLDPEVEIRDYFQEIPLFLLNRIKELINRD